MDDLLFREWVVETVASCDGLDPADLCSVPFKPSPLFRAAAAEYRKGDANRNNSFALKKEWRNLPLLPQIATTVTSSVEAARERLRAAHKDAFDDGFRTGALGFGPTWAETRLPGGYPKTFFEWSQAARDAWFGGHYAGLAHAKKLKDGAA